MAVTVKKLFQNLEAKYGTKLLAGSGGLNRLVDWIHIVEDKDVSSFLHGQEIVFTAGILCSSEEWLLAFTEELYRFNASAFVINCGPYIPEVPDQIIRFCDDNKFPLYTIPWKTRMVDMTRNFCREIIENENNEANAEALFKDILFGVGGENTLSNLERLGFRREYHYNFICILPAHENGLELWQDEMVVLKRIAERIARELHEVWLSFAYQEKIVLTLIEYNEEEIKTFLDQFFRELSHRKLLSKVYLSVGENIQGLQYQSRNFENTLHTGELAVCRKQRILSYEELGIDKIVLAVKDRVILQKYYEETIGRLRQYDEENDTNLFEFMKNYLACDGSVQAVSEKMYIHRNTVNNYLRRVEKVLALDEFGLEEKMKLLLAYHVAEIL